MRPAGSRLVSQLSPRPSFPLRSCGGGPQNRLSFSTRPMQAALREPSALTACSRWVCGPRWEVRTAGPHCGLGLRPRTSISSRRALCFQKHLTSVAVSRWGMSGPNASAGLSLAPENSFTALVNVDSSQDPTIKRVIPFSSLGSLIFRKVNCANPGVGSRMPLGRPSLSLDEQRLIRDWIDQGAVRCSANAYWSMASSRG
jgi:hypothetical protein